MTPAPAGTGIVFRRSDLEFFPIPASWKHVARVSYATSLMRQGVLIQTTEHLLSTLYSFAIDNAYIEIDNLEVPILDGSGKPFVDLLRTVGRAAVAPAAEVSADPPPGDGARTARSASRSCRTTCFRLTCEIDFPAPIGKQSIEMEVTPERYAAELSPARTFGFEHELDQLREMGLIRGASLDSAVCFTAEGVLNPGGLRFPDECCRHKALDLIGDLALIGRPLLGHVIAERAGHAMHTALVAKIMSDPSLYDIVTFDQLAARVAESLVAST